MDWNEWEELAPTPQVIVEITKANPGDSKAITAEVQESARGAVRTHKPDLERMTDLSGIIAAPNAQYYLVRLGFEMDLAADARRAGSRFSFVRLTARLSGAADGDALPRVYDLYPKDLYEGEPRVVKVEFGPEIKVGEGGGSLGKISTDIQIGTVSPAIVAYKGRDECEPRWELTPKQKELIGIRNSWLIVELHAQSRGAELRVRVEADIETKWGLIPVAPRERVWENRPSIRIGG